MTLYEALCIVIVASWAIFFGVYLFIFVPKSEELKRLKKENKRQAETIERLSKTATDCANDRINDAALYSEKFLDYQKQAIEMQKIADERVAEAQREADRQRQNAENWAAKFDQYRLRQIGGNDEKAAV